MKVIIYNNTDSLKVFDSFIECINAQNFKYNSFDLLKFGIKEEESDAAVLRALQVCRIANLDVKPHFKACYMEDQKAIIKYWMFSETGLKLVLINSGIINKHTAKIQIEITFPTLVVKK